MVLVLLRLRLLRQMSPFFSWVLPIQTAALSASKKLQASMATQLHAYETSGNLVIALERRVVALLILTEY